MASPTVRIVLDTNVVVSALLWEGTPYALLQAIRAVPTARLFAAERLIAELTDVLGRPGCARRLAMIGRSARDLIEDYLSVIEIVDSQPMPSTTRDPNDDHVLGCGLTANAQMIVTGDRDLLMLHPFRAIQILSPAEALKSIAQMQTAR